MTLNPEDVMQINLMNWLRYNYPEIERDTIHIPLQRKCSIQQGVLLKKMGVKKGTSDLFIAVPKGRYHGCFLELKEGKGKPSQEQKEFLARMTVNGYFCACVTGLEAAQAVIREYLMTEDFSHGKPIC